MVISGCLKEAHLFLFHSCKRPLYCLLTVVLNDTSDRGKQSLCLRKDGHREPWVSSRHPSHLPSTHCAWTEASGFSVCLELGIDWEHRSIIQARRQAIKHNPAKQRKK